MSIGNTAVATVGIASIAKRLRQGIASRSILENATAKPAKEQDFVARYVGFMYNEANVCKCEDCPENIGCDSWQGRLPCGQQNCWVSAHCDALKDSGSCA